jgi:hypothetical protein
MSTGMHHGRVIDSVHANRMQLYKLLGWAASQREHRRALLTLATLSTSERNPPKQKRRKPTP